MTDAVIVTSLGSSFRIRAFDSTIARRIAQLYDACLIERTPPGETAFDIDICGGNGADFEVRANGEPYWSGADHDRALEWCVWLVNNAATARASALVLHTAAAAIDDRIVLLTGPSGSGKSTLVAALTMRGAVYLGDDTVIVDDGSALGANPKPIAVDDDARAALLELSTHHAELRDGSALLAPSALGTVMRAGAKARARVIVRTTYRVGASTVLERIAPAAAAEVIADQSFNFAALGGAALRSVAAIARHCHAFDLEFSDLGAAADAVIDAVRHADALGHEDPLGSSNDGLHVEFCRGEALIWNDDAKELHHLSPTATAIWRAYELSGDPEQIAAAVQCPPSPAVLADIRNCIEQLRENGLLPVGARRRPPMAV